MECSTFIRSMVGHQRTLVITCLECSFDVEYSGNGNVFRYTTLGNLLNAEDVMQKESIISFVEFKKCSQIIVTGHYNCRAIPYLLNEVQPCSAVYQVRQELQKLYTENHIRLLPYLTGNRMLVEKNVIAQCQKLLTFSTFAAQVADNALAIIGVVVDPNQQINKLIYQNGIIINDLVSIS